MKMTVLAFVIIFWVSFSAVYGPWLFFLGGRALSGEELAELDPKWARMGICYHRFSILWYLFTVLILVWVGIWVKDWVGMRVAYLVSAFLASAGIFVGLFAAFTGIYPEGSKSGVWYIFEPSERVRRVGKFQALFAFTVAVVSFLLVFVELK